MTARGWIGDLRLMAAFLLAPQAIDTGFWAPPAQWEKLRDLN